MRNVCIERFLFYCETYNKYIPRIFLSLFGLIMGIFPQNRLFHPFRYRFMLANRPISFQPELLLWIEFLNEIFASAYLESQIQGFWLFSNNTYQILTKVPKNYGYLARCGKFLHLQFSYISAMVRASEQIHHKTNLGAELKTLYQIITENFGKLTQRLIYSPMHHRKPTQRDF